MCVCVCVISDKFLLRKYSDVKSSSNLPAYSSQTPPPLLKGCLVSRVVTKSHADKSIQCLLVVLYCCFDIFCVQVRPSTCSCLHNSTTTCEEVFFDLQAVLEEKSTYSARFLIILEGIYALWD